MNHGLVLEPPPARMARACAFTLATALAWIGHDCTGGCPAQTLELHADVWFINDPAAAGEDHVNTVVVVRFGETPSSATSHQTLLSRVNDCVRRDHIYVREREATSSDGYMADLVANAVPRPPLPVGDRRDHPTRTTLTTLPASCFGPDHTRPRTPPAPPHDRDHGGPGLSGDHAYQIHRIDHTIADTRWPHWGTAVGRLGIGSVLSLPMTAPDQRAIGSITLYAYRYAAFAPTDVEVAAVLARHATIAYLNAHQTTALDTNATHQGEGCPAENRELTTAAVAAYRSVPGIPAPRAAADAQVPASAK